MVVFGLEAFLKNIPNTIMRPWHTDLHGERTFRILGCFRGVHLCKQFQVQPRVELLLWHSEALCCTSNQYIVRETKIEDSQDVGEVADDQRIESFESLPYVSTVALFCSSVNVLR